MSAEDVTDKDTFYSVLADSDIHSYLFEPEYMAEEMQQREADAWIGQPHKSWQNFPLTVHT